MGSFYYFLGRILKERLSHLQKRIRFVLCSKIISTVCFYYCDKKVWLIVCSELCDKEFLFQYSTYQKGLLEYTVCFFTNSTNTFTITTQV